MLRGERRLGVWCDALGDLRIWSATLRRLRQPWGVFHSLNAAITKLNAVYALVLFIKCTYLLRRPCAADILWAAAGSPRWLKFFCRVSKLTHSCLLCTQPCLRTTNVRVFVSVNCNWASVMTYHHVLTALKMVKLFKLFINLQSNTIFISLFHHLILSWLSTAPSYMWSFLYIIGVEGRWFKWALSIYYWYQRGDFAKL